MKLDQQSAIEMLNSYREISEALGGFSSRDDALEQMKEIFLQDNPALSPKHLATVCQPFALMYDVTSANPTASDEELADLLIKHFDEQSSSAPSDDSVTATAQAFILLSKDSILSVRENFTEENYQATAGKITFAIRSSLLRSAKEHGLSDETIEASVGEIDDLFKELLTSSEPVEDIVERRVQPPTMPNWFSAMKVFQKKSPSPSA